VNVRQVAAKDVRSDNDGTKPGTVDLRDINGHFDAKF
jgi:hypothetical protein